MEKDGIIYCKSTFIFAKFIEAGNGPGGVLIPMRM